MPGACEAPRKAVVLLSGGLDSCTAAALAKAEGFELYALTVAYGQRHAAELDAARRVAAALGVVRHVELQLDLSAFGGSALTGAGPVPKDRVIGEPGIPSTYVPARNTVFLSLGLDYGLTSSCYDPGPEGVPCGRCDSCAIRARGFADAGVPDPRQ